MKGYALFSKCGFYRWHLTRIVSNSKRQIIFIGLNPSLARSNNDDPTLRRILNFCREWDYGTLFMINLFARVSKSYTLLEKIVDPIGRENNRTINLMLNYWSLHFDCDLWLGWGSKGTILDRNIEVIKMIEKYCIYRNLFNSYSYNPFVIGKTNNGHPRHPLYVPKGEILKPFKIID